MSFWFYSLLYSFHPEADSVFSFSYDRIAGVSRPHLLNDFSLLIYRHVAMLIVTSGEKNLDV